MEIHLHTHSVSSWHGGRILPPEICAERLRKITEKSLSRWQVIRHTYELLKAITLYHGVGQSIH
jgi:hypothetical protein